MLALFLLIFCGNGVTGSVVDQYNPNVDGTIYASTIHKHGGTVIGGMFISVGGETSMRIARIADNGSLVPGFTPFNGASSTVFALASQEDGKILVGGAFTSIGASTRNRIARLHAIGSVDTAFNPPQGADATVRALLVQPDGRILVSGEFATIGGVPRVYLARLDENGGVDPHFDAGFEYGTSFGASYSVNTLALQADGRILAGGLFTTTVHGKPRSHLVRFNADGSLDETFNPGADGVVSSLLVQPDGKIIVGGSFGSLGGHARSRIARLHPCGALDTSFDPGTGGSAVNTLALQPDGRILAGGAFTTMGGMARHRIARLEPDGAVDAAFNPGADGTVHNILFRRVFSESPDRIIASGYFTKFGGMTRNSIAGMSTQAGLDTSFMPDPDGDVFALAVQADGKVLVGGTFTELRGTSRERIARLNADGTLDAQFNPGTNRGVLALTRQPDGKVLVAGDFNQIGGSIRFFIARVHPDGSLDADFTANADATVWTLALQRDGKILVGGGFGLVAGHERNHIARLNADGSLDAGFQADANGMVRAILVQRDGRILVGGDFTRINGTDRSNLARLEADGTLDTTFNADVNNWVNSLVEQPGGRILVGGRFTSINGVTRNRIARLNPVYGALDTDFNPNANDEVSSIALLDEDGKILIAGRFTGVGGFSRARLARLHGNGAVDGDYHFPMSAAVRALAVQGNGGVLVGGSFDYSANPDFKNLVRIRPSDFAKYELDLDSQADTIYWYRGGGAPAPQRVIFEGSDATGGWHFLGDGERFSSLHGTGWRLTNPHAGFDTFGLIRARAYHTGGMNNASQSVHESVLWLRALQYPGPFRVIKVDRGPPAVIHVEPWLPDMRYTLQYRTCLTAGEWTDVPGQTFIPGGGEPLEDAAAAGRGRTFYRVRIDTP